MQLREIPWKDRFVESACALFESRVVDGEFIINKNTRPARVAQEWFDRINHYFPVAHPSNEAIQTVLARKRGIFYVYSAVKLAREFAFLPEGMEWERDNGLPSCSIPFISGLLMSDARMLGPLFAALERRGEPSLAHNLLHNWSQSYWHTDENVLMDQQFRLGFRALCFSRKVPLLAAVSTNNTEGVRSLLATGSDPNAQDVHLGLSPLYLSVDAPNGEIFRMLLSAGAKADSASGWTMATPLHKAVAASEGQRTNLRVRMLLDAGADANAKDSRGMTPLHGASALRDSEAVSVLLEAGSDPCASTISGNTPLHYAARALAKSTIGLLLDAGADPNALDEEGSTPLHLAASSDPNNNTANEHVKDAAIRALVVGGANLEATDVRGRTPLHYAADNLDPAIVGALVEAGAERNVVDSQGRTPKNLAEADKPLSFHGTDFKDRKLETLKHLAGTQTISPY